MPLSTLKLPKLTRVPHSLTTWTVACLLVTSAISLPARALAEEPSAVASFRADSLDNSVRPGDDFARYVNGNWERTTNIPAENSRWDLFRALSQETNRNTANLLENRPSTASRPHDFYAAYMNEAAIDTKGLAPLLPALARINAIANKTELARALGAGLRADVDPLNTGQFYTENLFGLWVAPGLHDPAHYKPYLLQGGLGLVDREYYLSTNAKMAVIRTKYQSHIAKLFQLAGFSNPEQRSARVFALERAMAKVHASREASEDTARADKTWTSADFDRLAPGLVWGEFFDAAGLSEQASFTVWHSTAIQGEAALVGRTPLPVWKDYLAFHALNHFSEVLPKAFADAQFDFYGRTMLDTPKQEQRWKRAVRATNLALPDAVGRLYVERHFSAEAKSKVQAMAADILAAFDRRISQLEWMGEATKAQARAKLKTTYVGVGYSDSWRDDTGLEILSDDALGNVHRAEVFYYRQQISKLGQPVNLKEWSAPAQLVNAFSQPVHNSLIFPAAILQPPFFDPAASDAVNYGAIGAVIGHEISHNFDSQGAKFDSEGRLRDWWTKSDLVHFQKSSAALAKQFSAYRPFPDLAVNGVQTSSENIADLAGVLVAHEAFRAKLSNQVMTAQQLSEQDQQFFITFAKNWRGKSRESAQRQHIIADGHAPSQYRVATVRNLDAWYRAFGVEADQRLYLSPAARVRMW